MVADDTLVMILAGGEGKRLYPLTRDRAKPAVPFGGRYRIIDFVINNFINSGFYKLKILTQYKSDSLNKHIVRTWPLSPIINQYVDLIPAQMRIDGHWYKGTADAVFQNIHHILAEEEAKYIAVFGGDHIYKMNVEQMLDFHKQNNADLTISAIPIPIEEAGEYGIMEVDDNWHLTNFIEKPKTTPKHLPGDPTKCLAFMGNYFFNRNKLIKELRIDADIQVSNHDFGKNVIPKMLEQGDRIFVYDFAQNTFPGMEESERGYWRDVGTMDAYWQANMDLLAYDPEFNLYTKEWPLELLTTTIPLQNLSGKSWKDVALRQTLLFQRVVSFQVVHFQDAYFLQKLESTVFLALSILLLWKM
ncbi:MAG: sugar phosphate nucleotidyltransferase [Candidatus Gastranaerophilaceae bacterium]